MKILVIPDIHNRWKSAQDIICSKEYDKVIFLGDYFDDYFDTPEDVKETAIWLKDALTLKNSIFLFGNHDLPYAFPLNGTLMCSGWTKEKCKAINSVMTVKDWAKFKLCHYEDGFLFSHAGAHPYVFGTYNEPVPTVTSIKERCEAALHHAKSCMPDLVLNAGEMRGGNQYRGGITWLDWREFETIKGISQVVGHTPNIDVRVKLGEDSINFCIDTHLNHIGWLEDGNFAWEKV